jgi:acyl carrier protein
MVLDEVVREALEGLLGSSASSIPRSADLANHGLTSVQAIELIFGLEDTLGIELSDDLITRDTFRSIDSLCAVLETAMSAA